jgi:hypothetical protein
MPTRTAPAAATLLPRLLLAWLTPLLAAVPVQAADDTVAALPAVTVSAYPVPMLDVDGKRKFVAVIGSDGVEIRRCQHMVVTSRNYLACEFNEGSRRYNVVIPIVRNAVDVREPWSYVAPGVYQ